MGKGAIAIGIVFILFGIFLFAVSKFNIVAVIYGTVSIILGIALIVLYKEEDKVEQRKDINKRKSKK